MNRSFLSLRDGLDLVGASTSRLGGLEVIEAMTSSLARVATTSNDARDIEEISNDARVIDEMSNDVMSNDARVIDAMSADACVIDVPRMADCDLRCMRRGDHRVSMTSDTKFDEAMALTRSNPSRSDKTISSWRHGVMAVRTPRLASWR